VVMMLGAQRVVLVPFRFPVFDMILRKGSSPIPTDGHIERSWLGPARTALALTKD